MVLLEKSICCKFGISLIMWAFARSLMLLPKILDLGGLVVSFCLLAFVYSLFEFENYGFVRFLIL